MEHLQKEACSSPGTKNLQKEACSSPRTQEAYGESYKVRLASLLSCPLGLLHAAEHPVGDIGDIRQQTDRDYLREQILLQEQRISQLHQQLMQHQQVREQRRQGAAAAVANAEGPLNSGSRLHSRFDKSADPYKYESQGSQQLTRHASSSTKGSSRHSSDECPKVSARQT